MNLNIIVPVLLLLLLLGISALAMWLYRRYYIKQINRALENKLKNKDDAVVPVPPLHSAYKVILFLLLFVCFCVWEAKKNEEIRQLQQYHDIIYDTVNRTWSDVQVINARLSDIQRIFTSFDYRIESLDPAARIMEVRVTAQPKEEYLDPSVTLRYNGKIFELTKGEDGSYSGIVTMDPFRLQTSDHATLCLTEPGRTRAEDVYFHPYVRGWFPTVQFTLDDSELLLKDHVFSIKGRPVVSVSEPEKIRSMHLLIKQKDEVLKDLDLTTAMREQTQGELLQQDCTSLSPVSLVLRWEDCYGLIHEAEQYSIATDSTGLNTVILPSGGFELLYDAGGSFLCELR